MQIEIRPAEGGFSALWFGLHRTPDDGVAREGRQLCLRQDCERRAADAIDRSAMLQRVGYDSIEALIDAGYKANI